jgi:hypothetical protein
VSTSGTYYFTVSRDDLVREALINTGKIGGTQYIAPQLTIDCSRKLNMLVKQWMGTQDFAPGLKMWTRADADLFLSSSSHTYRLGPTGDQWAQGVATSAHANYQTGQITVAAAAAATAITVGTVNAALVTVGDYLVFEMNSGDIYATTATAVNTGTGVLTIPAPGLPGAISVGAYVWNYTTKGQRPLELATCILRDINNNDTSMDFMTLQTYENLPTKAASTYLSDPTAIYYQADLTYQTIGTLTAPCGTLRIDCGGAVDVTKHLHMVYLRPLQDFVNPLDNPDFPQVWFLPLAWGLTKQICPMMNAQWDATMEANLNEALAIARNTNSETSDLYFQPNADRP